MRREAELAAGHGEVRLAGFVTVSGRDRDDLRRRLRRGPRARGARAARAAPHVRPAGRRVHVHAAAVPGAEVRRCAPSSGPGTAARPGTPRRSTRSSPRAGSAVAACSSAATPAAARSATTRGSCTATGALDDPNVIVLGKLGQGKSALVKTLLWRMLLFGRRAFVLDVKREYGPLCRAVGVAADLARARRRACGSIRSPRGPRSTRSSNCCAPITVTALGGPLTQVEAAALREALRTVRTRGCAEPTLPEIAAVLFAPVAEMAARLRTTAERLARDARRAALALQDLCEGPLRGMFDGPTTPGPRPRRQAARARPARGPRLAGGRHPDGLRHARG